MMSNFAQIPPSSGPSLSKSGQTSLREVGGNAKKHDRFYRGALHRQRGLNSRWERTLPDNSDDWSANNVINPTLTRREAEVAGLVSQGLANKVIAGQLGVAEGTVKIHLHNIYRKLQVPNRTGLMLREIATR